MEKIFPIEIAFEGKGWDAMFVNYFKGLGINHDLIVSSPANRALSTYDILIVMDMKSIS